MNDQTRLGLINQMGFSMGDYVLAANQGEWQKARAHLTKLIAGLGMMAMEIEENDPSA